MRFNFRFWTFRSKSNEAFFLIFGILIAFGLSLVVVMSTLATKIAALMLALICFVAGVVIARIEGEEREWERRKQAEQERQTQQELATARVYATLQDACLTLREQGGVLNDTVEEKFRAVFTAAIVLLDYLPARERPFCKGGIVTYNETDAFLVDLGVATKSCGKLNIYDPVHHREARYVFLG